MKNVNVRYVAMLREQAGVEAEAIETACDTAAELYRELRGRHGFSLEGCHLRVAVNDRIVAMETGLKPGDEITYLPPFAGG